MQRRLAAAVLALASTVAAPAAAQPSDPGAAGASPGGTGASPGGTATGTGASPAGGSDPLDPYGPADEGPGDAVRIEQEDLQPTVRLATRDELTLYFGGLVQLQAAAVGDEALVENGDPASNGGFRLRRARFGVEARIEERYSLLVGVNPLETDEDVGTISDARLSFLADGGARYSFGTGKVPFARGALESSRTLLSVERPLSVDTITPERRLGMTVENAVLGGRLAYLAALMNGTEGFSLGNQFGGLLGGLRIEFSPRDPVDVRRPERDGVTFGIAGIYDRGPATTTLAYSADVLATFTGFVVKAEGLCDRRIPAEAAEPAPGIPDDIDRCGAYAEVAYALDLGWRHVPVLVPSGRIEYFDDNLDLEDAGDVTLLSAGVNVDFHPEHLRGQLHYVHRNERESRERSNDALVFSLQGAF